MKFSIEKNNISLIVLLTILIFVSNLHAQDSLKQTFHSAAFKTQFFQIQDAFNYGLVFNGLNLVGSYSMEKIKANSTFLYEPEFSFGANFNKGVGLTWGFVPVDVFLGFNINKGKSRPFILGAYFLTNYNWQLYPELQSGHMFWMTSLEIGPQAVFSLGMKHRELKIILSNSIAGFTSRPEPATETYFYSLTFSDFVTNAHSNLEIGSYNLFNHTNLEIELLSKTNKKLSLAYEFEYFGYFKNPELSYISHSLNFKWKIGKR